MDKDFLDECFKARIAHQQKRFPIKEFKRCFKEQYVQNGLVMIQTTTNSSMSSVMIDDKAYGVIFNNEHNRDLALRIIRLWGFSVTLRREVKENRKCEAYIAQLPDDYLKHHLGSSKAGIIRTGLRHLKNVNRIADRRLGITGLE